MKFFAGLNTVAEIKAEYKRLAMRWHPDRPGGDTAEMQKINTAYQQALKACHGEQTVDAQGEKHTYWYNQEHEEAIARKIAEVIESGILSNDNVELWLVGKWLWVMGETKPHRNTLGREGLGFRWNPKRAAWQWHLPGQRLQYNRHANFDELASYYGATQITQNKASIQ